MTLEEIQELVEKYLQINDSELDLESIKIPQLHSKYLKTLADSVRIETLKKFKK